MTNNSTEKEAIIENVYIASTVILCIVGTIGNTLVVLIVYRQNKMRTVTNYLIVNLATSDLFVLLINIPLDLIVTFHDGKWLYGAGMCKLINPLQTMATTVSVYSLVAISIGRYIAIVYPFRAQLQTTHAKWLILIAWTIGFVLVIPFVLALELRDGECQEDFEAVGMVAGAYTLCVFVAQYVVPLTIIVFCYRRIGVELSRSNIDHENSRLIKEQQKETRKVIKILRLVVTAFAVLVLPIHLLYIWIDFFHGDSSPKFRMLQFISALMLYSNSASNPILYNICNEQFRNGFKQYFKPCLKTFCPMGSCINEEYSNEAKELEYTSLKYSPRTRLSTISQISNTRNSLTQNGRLMSVSFDGEKTKRNKDSRSTSV